MRGRTRAGRVRRAPAAAALLAAVAALGPVGCADFRVPGQGADRDYKGDPDPTIMALPSESESALAERFERVQAR